VNGGVLLKVIDKHDVAVHIADQRIEDPAAIGGDRQATTEKLVPFKNWPYLPGCEIKVAERSGRLGRNEIDSFRGRPSPKGPSYWNSTF
jgi:hypothetical protein